MCYFWYIHKQQFCIDTRCQGPSKTDLLYHCYSISTDSLKNCLTQLGKLGVKIVVMQCFTSELCNKFFNGNITLIENLKAFLKKTCYAQSVCTYFLYKISQFLFIYTSFKYPKWIFRFLKQKAEVKTRVFYVCINSLTDFFLVDSYSSRRFLF